MNCPRCQLEFLPAQTPGGHCPRCLLLGEIDEPEPPPVFAKGLAAYQLMEMLGQGGMGKVYRAVERSTGRVVALKLVQEPAADSPKAMGVRQRFFAEAQVLGKLDHPNIVPIYETYWEDQVNFFTMRLVKGGNLVSRRLEFSLTPGRKDKVREQTIARFCAKIARALQHVHECGVLHRDLKPSNILVDESGQPQVSDFGLAVVLEAEETTRLTLTGQLIGTPAYLAPELAEQGLAVATVRSDVYSLGVILYELICGRLPHDGINPLAIMREVVSRDATHPTQLNAAVSRDLATIASRCLEREAKRRYGAAADLAVDLENFSRGQPILAREVDMGERLVKWVQRSPAQAVAAAISLAAVLVGSTVSTWQWWQAVQANKKLTAELRVSTAQRLAASIPAEMVSSPSRALLVAAESVEWTRRADGSVEPTAYAALLGAVAAVGGSQVLPAASGTTCLTQNETGQWLAAGRLDGSLVLTSLETERSVPREARGHQGPLRTLAWRPGVFFLISGGEDGQVLGWNLDTFVSKPLPVSLKQPSFITSLAVSDDGKVLAVCSTPPNAKESLLKGPLPIHTPEDELTTPPEARGMLRLYAMQSWEQLLEFPLPFRSAKAVKFSKQKNVVLVEDQRRAVPLVLKLAPNLRTARPCPLLEQPYPVHDAALAPQGHRLALCGKDRCVRLYDLSHEQPAPRELGRYSWIPDQLAFSPDGTTLAMLTRHDDKLRLYALEEPEIPVQEIRIGQRTGAALCFSPDGKWILATGGDSVIVATGLSPRNKGDRLELRGPDQPVVALHIEPMAARDTSLVATLANGTAWRWEFDQSAATASPRRVGKLGKTRVMLPAPDHQSLVALDRDRLQVLPLPAEKSGVESRQITLPFPLSASSAAFSPNGKTLAICGVDDEGRWSDLVLQNLVQPQTAVLLHAGALAPEIFAVKFHPQGNLFTTETATDVPGFTYALVERMSEPGGAWKTLQKHGIASEATALALAPNGQWAAIGTHRRSREDAAPLPGCLQLAHLPSPHLASPQHTWVPWPKLPQSKVTAVAFSPDSRFLLAAGSFPEVLLLDLHQPDPWATVQRVPFGSGEIAQLALSPEGAQAAVVESGGKAHLWKFRESPHYITPLPELHSVAHITFSADGKQLYTADAEGFLWQWDLDVATLLAHAHRIAGRKLSSQERERLAVTLP